MIFDIKLMLWYFKDRFLVAEEGDAAEEVVNLVAGLNAMEVHTTFCGIYPNEWVPFCLITHF